MEKNVKPVDNNKLPRKFVKPEGMTKEQAKRAAEKAKFQTK